MSKKFFFFKSGGKSFRAAAVSSPLQVTEGAQKPAGQTAWWKFTVTCLSLQPPLCQLTWIPLQLPSAPSCRAEPAPLLLPLRSTTVQHPTQMMPRSWRAAVAGWQQKVFTVKYLRELCFFDSEREIIRAVKPRATKGHSRFTSIRVLQWGYWCGSNIGDC